MRAIANLKRRNLVVALVGLGVIAIACVSIAARGQVAPPKLANLRDVTAAERAPETQLTKQQRYANTGQNDAERRVKAVSETLQAEELETSSSVKGEIHNLIDVVYDDRIGPIYIVSPISQSEEEAGNTEPIVGTQRIEIFSREAILPDGEQPVDGEEPVTAAAGGCTGRWQCPPGASVPDPRCTFSCGGGLHERTLRSGHLLQQRWNIEQQLSMRYVRIVAE
jgi:hypothetical protein